LLADAQTSGGLLLCLPGEAAEDLKRRAGEEMLTAVIGEVLAGEPGSVFVAQ
jgi:hypothetical protein